MSANMVLILFGVIGVLVGVSYVIDWYTVDDPNIGLVRRFGKILDRRLLPGRHHLWQWGGLFLVDELIIVPGGWLDFEIPVENAVTHNVEVDVDLRVQLSILTPHDYDRSIDDHYPAWGPAKRLVTLVKLNRGESLMTVVNSAGERIPGKLERILTSQAQDAITDIIMGVDPARITKSRRVKRMIIDGIQAQIAEFVDSWSRVRKIMVEDIRVPTEIERTRVIRDAQAEKQRLLITTQGEVERIQQYRELGEDYGKMVALGDMIKGAKNVNLNWLGGGLAGLFGALLEMKERKDHE